jgi:hypothetical protein
MFEEASENPLVMVTVEPPVSFNVMAPAPLATWRAAIEKFVSTVDVNVLGVVLLKIVVTPDAGSPNDQLEELFQFCPTVGCQTVDCAFALSAPKNATPKTRRLFRQFMRVELVARRKGSQGPNCKNSD